jgi:superfamily II DNA helicase RecQ
MNYRVFQYPLPAPPELEDLNAYLASHRVAAVTQHLVQAEGGAMLVFIVQTVAGEAPGKGRSPEARTDYREVLNAEDFQVFSRLRDERKKIAEAEGVPVYAIFTNAQLAEMVTRKVCTPADMGGIEGIGKARVEKHAARLLTILTAQAP